MRGMDEAQSRFTKTGELKVFLKTLNSVDSGGKAYQSSYSELGDTLNCQQRLYSSSELKYQLTAKGKTKGSRSIKLFCNTVIVIH